MKEYLRKGNTKLRLIIILAISAVAGSLMLFTFYQNAARSSATGTPTAVLNFGSAQVSAETDELISLPINITLSNTDKLMTAVTTVLKLPDETKVEFVDATNGPVGQCGILEEVDYKVITSADGGKFVIITKAAKSGGIGAGDEVKCLVSANFKIKTLPAATDTVEIVGTFVNEDTKQWANTAVDVDGEAIVVSKGDRGAVSFRLLGGVGSTCIDTFDCAMTLVCATSGDTKTCQQGAAPGGICSADANAEIARQCGNGYSCSTATTPPVCVPVVCSDTVVAGCLTPTPLPTSTFTPTPTNNPTPTPYSGSLAPVCSGGGCTPRPYYTLFADGPSESNPFNLRYYATGEGDVPATFLYTVAIDNLESSNITSSEFVYTIDDGGYWKLPGGLPDNLYKIKIRSGATSTTTLYVADDQMATRWSTSRADVSGVSYQIYTRQGYIQEPTPTRGPPTATPTGFNLYLDPGSTDASRDGAVVKLQTWVRQGVRRGEIFTVRVVASPFNNSELVHLQALKVPLQYALPGDSRDIVLTSITNNNNPDCNGFSINYPDPTTNVTTLSSFYLKATARDSRPKQLAPDTCVAELSFTVSSTADPGSSTLKLLSTSEAAAMNNGSGVPDIETQVPLRGTYALGYHLSLVAPTTPAVTPATVHPKIGIQYDPSNKSKTFTIDTSRPVPAGSADLVLKSFAQSGFRVIRKPPIPPATSCGPLALQATVYNVTAAAVPQFSVTINGEKVNVPNGLAANSSVNVDAPVVYFNNDGVNTLFADSDDVIIESREDNNYQEKRLVFADIPDNDCPRPTGAPTATPGPTDAATPTPEYVVDMSKVNVKMSVKIQGTQSSTFSSQYSRLKFGVAIGGGSLDDNTDYVYNTFTHKGEGVYEGMVTFDPTKVRSATNYRIIVKGPKHLAKRFCVANPTGGYAYFCPPNAASVSLNTGLNEFDFSGVQLIAGDLPLDGSQDGVVDSSDLTFIRDNLGVKSADIIKVGDLNFDGIVDTQDYSIIINNLVNNEDEN